MSTTKVKVQRIMEWLTFLQLRNTSWLVPSYRSVSIEKSKGAFFSSKKEDYGHFNTSKVSFQHLVLLSGDGLTRLCCKRETFFVTILLLASILSRPLEHYFYYCYSDDDDFYQRHTFSNVLLE